MTNFFDIIVPIYMVENYLPQCIESVLKQSFKSYKLILVDDGSLDNCPQICENYKVNNNQIIVIHKKNGGVSDARNAGLKQITGKYTIFLDGDDLMCHDSLEKTYNAIINNDLPDLIMGNYSIVGNSEVNHELQPKSANSNCKITDTPELLNSILAQKNEIPWAVWQNVFKNEVVIKHHLRFDPTLIMAEDCLFFMEFLKLSKNVAYLNYPLTNYRVTREGSLTSTTNFKKVQNQLMVFSKYYHEYSRDASSENLISIHFARKFANAITSVCFLEKSERDQISKIINTNRIVLKSAKGFKYMIALIIWKSMGYNQGGKLIYTIRNILKTNII